MESEYILIIDEDKEFLASVLDFLIVHMNCENVVWAVSPEEAEEKIKTYKPRLVILDLGMKKLRGPSASAHSTGSSPVRMTPTRPTSPACSRPQITTSSLAMSHREAGSPLPPTLPPLPRRAPSRNQS